MSDKGLNCSKYQAYNVDFSEDRPVKVTHIGIGEVVEPPKHVTITTDVELKDGWFEATATVALDPSEFVLHTLIPKGAEFLAGSAAGKRAKQVLQSLVDTVVSNVDRDFCCCAQRLRRRRPGGQAGHTRPAQVEHQGCARCHAVEAGSEGQEEEYQVD